MKYLLCSVLFVLFMSGCVTVNDSTPGGKDTLERTIRSGHGSKELLITFPAWISESEKLSALEASAKIKASSKCQSSPYVLTDIRSTPYSFGITLVTEVGINTISANIKCNVETANIAAHLSVSSSEINRLRKVCTTPAAA